jgi:hypothetical protein
MESLGAGEKKEITVSRAAESEFGNRTHKIGFLSHFWTRFDTHQAV